MSTAPNRGNAPAPKKPQASHFSAPDGVPPVAPQESFGPAYPLDALPSFGRDIVRSVASNSETPPDFAATMFLAALAVSCQRRLRVSPEPGKYWPLNIYVATIGESGSGKSEVVSTFARPFVQHQLQESIRLKDEIAASDQELQVLKYRAKAAQKCAVQAETEEDRATTLKEAQALAQQVAATKVPSVPMHLLTDTTPEALVVALEQQGERIAFLHAEGGPLKNIMGGYRDTPDFEIYKCAWGGERYSTVRIGRPGNHLLRPAITLGLLVQSNIICKLISDPVLRNEGVAARFLFSKPNHPSGFRSYASEPLDQSAIAAYSKRIFQLLALDIGDEEKTVSMSREARALFLEFARRVEPRKRVAGDLYPIRDWTNKVNEQVARVAALFHVADRSNAAAPWSEPIDASTMSRAIELGDYYIGHALATFSLATTDVVDDDVRRLLEWFKKRPTTTQFTRRELMRSLGGNRWLADTRKLNKILVRMEELGFIRELVDEKTRRVGPARNPLFEVLHIPRDREPGEEG